MYHLYIRYHWLTLATFCCILVLSSIILTHLEQLHPCYLCVFQRLLYILITSLALTIVWINNRTIVVIFKAFIVLLTISGIGTAGYQMWLQNMPAAQFACSGGGFNVIEILVIWLDKWIPLLFQANGNCASQEMIILGISLAGWSLIGFIISLLMTSWILHNEN